MSGLAIRWTSPLSRLSRRGAKGQRDFQVDDMRYELGMTLNLYGALLRERALEVLRTGKRALTVFEIFSFSNQAVLTKFKSLQKSPLISKTDVH